MTETTEQKPVKRVVQEETQALPVYTPAADIIEQPDAFELVAEMPGLEEKDTTVELEDDILTVHGTSPLQALPVEKRLLYSEYERCNYRRVFRIGKKVDRAGIEASMKQGLLRIRMPKAKEAQAHRIAVASSE